MIIHETAHQWWYGVVGNNEFKDPWLDEGLTEYSTVLFYEENPQYNQNRATLISNASQTYNFFIDVYSQVYGSVDKSMNRNLKEYKTEPEYVYITYVKGMLMFDSVRECVGKNKFIKALKRYYKDNKYKNTTPEKLISTFEKSCGTKLKNYFQSWLSGKEIIAQTNTKKPHSNEVFLLRHF